MIITYKEQRAVNELPIRLPLVGRKSEIATIKSLIKSQDSGLAVFFLEGEGGSGKTVLLEEACKIARASSRVLPPVFIDFYDTEMHSSRGLEKAIVDSIGPIGFPGYNEKDSSHPRDDAECWESFVAEYNSLTASKRALLCFDTAERIEPYQDSKVLQHSGGVTGTRARAWQFLTQRLLRLQNTTVILAARPTKSARLKNELESVYGPGVVHPLGSFGLKETRVYLKCDFRRSNFSATLTPEVVGKIHLLTEGRPIMVALASEWLKRGVWNSRIHPVSLKHLKHQKELADAEDKTGIRGTNWAAWYGPNGVKSVFERELVTRFRTLRSNRVVELIKCASICRKGCNSSLLSHLVGTPNDADFCRDVDDLYHYAFVKPPRRGDARQFFFLHDEMYDLLDKYYWKQEWPLTYQGAVEIDNKAIKWYKREIELKPQSKEKEWRRQQQLMIAECLYYRLDADPDDGYREYRHMSEIAIGSREVEWFDWLHHEILWFISNRDWRWPKSGLAGEVLRYDTHRHQVGLYIADDRNELARTEAEKAPNDTEPSGEPSLFRPGMMVLKATAEMYEGGQFTRRALDDFKIAIHELEEIRGNSGSDWLHEYLLGTAHLYLGLALTNELRLSEAESVNKQAAKHFRGIDLVRSRIAELLNNQAYVYTRQGKARDAAAFCEEALRIRRELGDEYDIGLSLNTLGIIYERRGRPVTAIFYSKQALDLFAGINSERGIILAKINLGRAYRRKARSPEWDKPEEDFKIGAEYLDDVINLQDKPRDTEKEFLQKKADTFYKIEARNELGCLYRDWAATLIEDKQVGDQAKEFLERSEGYLNEAIGLTRHADGQVISGMEFQEADCLEDKARVYYRWASMGEEPDEDRMKEMGKSLQQVMTRIPEPISVDDPRALILGRAYFQQARLALLRKRLNENLPNREIARNYAWAAGFIESYSEDAPELRKFAREASGWVAGLPSSDDIRIQIDEMAQALTEKAVKVGERERKLKSEELARWINGRLELTHGIRWPEGGEAPHG